MLNARINAIVKTHYPFGEVKLTAEEIRFKANTEDEAIDVYDMLNEKYVETQEFYNLRGVEVQLVSLHHMYVGSAR